MQEAWIPLLCPECGEVWESPPNDLPAPGTEFVCTHCGRERPVAEFVKTKEGLEMLKEFHE